MEETEGMSLEAFLGLIGVTVLLVIVMLAAYSIRCALDDWLWDLRRRKDDG